MQAIGLSGTVAPDGGPGDAALSLDFRGFGPKDLDIFLELRVEQGVLRLGDAVGRVTDYESLVFAGGADNDTVYSAAGDDLIGCGTCQRL